MGHGDERHRRTISPMVAVLPGISQFKLTIYSHDVEFAGSLPPHFFGSAGAYLMRDTLAKTNEPWPQGFLDFKSLIDQNVKNNMIPDLSLLSGLTVNKEATVSDLWVNQTKRLAYAKRILTDWAATKEVTGTGRVMDALLTPATPWPACPKWVTSPYFTPLTRRSGTRLPMSPTPTSGTSWTIAQQPYRSPT